MSLLSYILPIAGDPDSTEAPKVTTALTSILAWANGQVGLTNLNKALKEEIERSLGRLGPQTYSAIAEFTVGSEAVSAELEPSATRPVWVQVSVQAPANADPIYGLSFYVNGSEIPCACSNTKKEIKLWNFGFWVMPGQKWKCKASTMNTENFIVIYSYLDF
jgi:hypothetical protein